MCNTVAATTLQYFSGVQLDHRAKVTVVESILIAKQRRVHLEYVARIIKVLIGYLNVFLVSG